MFAPEYSPLIPFDRAAVIEQLKEPLASAKNGDQLAESRLVTLICRLRATASLRGDADLWTVVTEAVQWLRAVARRTTDFYNSDQGLWISSRGGQPRRFEHRVRL